MTEEKSLWGLQNQESVTTGKAHIQKKSRWMAWFHLELPGLNLKEQEHPPCWLGVLQREPAGSALSSGGVQMS